MTLLGFNFARWWAIVAKEFIQMRRDRLTFGMMIGIPCVQLILFGYAINSDPKHLPTAVLSADHSVFSRSLVQALGHSAYFDVVAQAATETEVQRMLAHGEVMFVIHIPEDFERKLLRGERPAVLMEADATDPAATSNALGTLQQIIDRLIDRDLTGPVTTMRGRPGPVELRIHRHYNPEGITQYNIVPGLLGVVLTMTMVIITAVAITRERERGTMENLLSTPARPAEVMLGKIVPYIIVGYLQTSAILLAARFLFQVPFHGSLMLLLAVMFVFIVANLSMGITFSTIARNQLQAMQMSFFFFLPSLLLSGFMFPFRGMPVWAQSIGSVFPLTHFLRIVRGILLKGNSLPDILPHLWPLTAFLVVALTLGIRRYRQTLD
ncbi:MAG: ABC transporter permease [Verrucomicrobiales bacterium]|nr:ABC transporter permease [Verrucomicrobiales bacterium]